MNAAAGMSHLSVSLWLLELNKCVIRQMEQMETYVQKYQKKTKKKREREQEGGKEDRMICWRFGFGEQ